MKIGLTIAGLLLAGFVLATLTVQTMAHSAPSGWKYPSNCCTPDGKECDPIPNDSVSVRDDGWYDVALDPGDHRHVKVAKIYRVEAHRIKDSGDGEYHACIAKDGSKIYCLFIPSVS